MIDLHNLELNVQIGKTLLSIDRFNYHDFAAHLGIDHWGIIPMIKQIFTQNQLTFNSSGTTGTAKQIELNAQIFISSAVRSIEHFNLTPNCSGSLCLPVDRIGGAMMLIRAMVGHHLLILEKPSSCPLTATTDFTSLVPYQLAKILQSPSQKTLLNQCRVVLIGGAELSPFVYESIKEKGKFYQTFGMTETASHIATRDVALGRNQPYQLMKGVVAGVTERQQLFLEMSSHRIVSNDIVQLHAREFQWLGRSDHMINSGGVKIYPESIENELAGLLPISWFLFGLAHSELGQQVALILEGELSAIESEKYRSLISNQIEIPYHQPKVVFNVETFLRTENGKVRRSATARAATRA